MFRALPEAQCEDCLERTSGDDSLLKMEVWVPENAVEITDKYGLSSVDTEYDAKLAKELCDM